jgi:hypothetical protein
VNNKQDRIIAERAQKQRHEQKLEQRRKLYRDSLEQVMEEERIALMRKHALLNPANKIISSSSQHSTSPSTKSAHYDLDWEG